MKRRNNAMSTILKKSTVLKKYCPECNYSLTKLTIESARRDYDCPSCQLSKLSSFYSPGSLLHKQIQNGFVIQKAEKKYKIP
jgi:transposase-like protein